MTLQICQPLLTVFASCKITMSPPFKSLLIFFHFFLSWSDCKISFLQKHHNSFTMCWTRLHLLQLYKSGLEKSPVSGKIIFDFMVRRFDGNRGKLLVRSLILSVSKAQEFKVYYVLPINVVTDSSSSDLSCVCIREERMEWAEWIWRSQSPPIWLA